MSDPIVAFYSGKGADHKGRRLDTILAFSDEELEGIHDYVQWLFPLEEPSSANPSAPLVGTATKMAFGSRRRLRTNLCRACTRMLAFYGLRCDGKEGVCTSVARGSNFAERRGHWLVPGSHNHLRLTRMLKSLHLLGLEDCSAHFYSCLEVLAGAFPGRISDTTMTYWRESQMGEAGISR